MEPLVSVMTPCYNAAGTLPRALASLVAQTYPHWECLLVDDGSDDRPLDIAARLGDPRIKPIRLDRNRGRGVARQVALDHASGDLLGMLDADDWFHPTKLGRQVELMAHEPRVALVGMGMGIVDVGNDLVGVRARGPAIGPPPVFGPVNGLAAPPVAFGPSMIRMDLARRVRFDGALRDSEDIDYLIRLLRDRRYAVLPDVSYVYSELASATLATTVRALRDSRRMYRAHRGCFPIGSRWNMTKTILKEAAYRAAFALGSGDRLIAARSRPPSPMDRAEFLTARRIVDELESRLFGEPCAPPRSMPDRARAAS